MTVPAIRDLEGLDLEGDQPDLQLLRHHKQDLRGALVALPGGDLEQTNVAQLPGVRPTWRGELDLHIALPYFI